MGWFGGSKESKESCDNCRQRHYNCLDYRRGEWCSLWEEDNRY